MNSFTKAIGASALFLAVAGTATGQSLPTKPGANINAITISCYRGPWENVIWDRPNAVFVDDLVRIGYTYPQAYAITQTVCRDIYGVRQPDYLRSSLLQIMADTPPGG